MYYDDEINWDLVRKNMQDDAEEVYAHYKKEFPIADYKKIAELMAKAYVSTKIGNKSCDAYDNWTMPDKYAYAILGIEDEYYQYEKESNEEAYYADLRDSDAYDCADCFDSMRGW